MAPKIVVFDDVFKHIKSYGWYQFFLAVVIQYACINIAGNFIFMSFATLKPTYTCLDPANLTDIDTCTLVTKCRQLNSTSVFHSLYNDFDFNCQNDWVPGLITTLQLGAGGFGEVVGGHLADYYGRRWVIYAGYICMTAFGLLCGIVPSWQLLTASIVATGFMYGFQWSPQFTYASEVVGKKYRILQSCAFQWSTSFQLIALLGYLTGDWRHYMLTINGICLPLVGLMLLYIESPRWLIQKNRLSEAATALNRLAKFNRRKTDFTEASLRDIDVGQKTNYTVWHLFSTRQLAAYSIVMIVTAISTESIPGVILFNVQDLAGSPFVNISLYGVLRFWTPVFMVLMERKTQWFGRRALFWGSQGTVSFCFLGIILIALLGKTADLKLLSTILALIGAAVNVGMVWVVYKQYITELYPTVMRAMAVGTFSVTSVAGMMLAPQLVYLKKFWHPIPYAGAAIISTLSLLLGLFILPETRGQPLPDTLNPLVSKPSQKALLENETERAEKLLENVA